MEKKVVEQLNWRYATKSFDKDKKLSKSQLDTLIESLRLSPSSFGLQLWKFVIVENPETREQLLAHSYGQVQVTEASHLLVLCSPVKVEENHISNYINDIAKTTSVEVECLDGFRGYIDGFLKYKNEQEQKEWMKNQVYIALGSLLTSAAMIGVDACPLEGFVPAKYDDILGLTELGLTSVVVCPVGFRSESDKYATTPKVRYNVEDLVIRK